MKWHAHIDHVEPKRRPAASKYLVRVTSIENDGTNGDELLRFEVDSALKGSALREHVESLTTEKLTAKQATIAEAIERMKAAEGQPQRSDDTCSCGEPVGGQDSCPKCGSWNDIYGRR